VFYRAFEQRAEVNLLGGDTPLALREEKMSKSGFALDRKRDAAALRYLEWLREACATGKSLTGLVREVASLGWGPGKLQPREYFLYRLYDDARFPDGAKKSF
jgi:hypothetical protein